MEVTRNTQQGSDTTPLTVPELLIAILEYLPPKDWCSAARVCKFWAELAAPILWGSRPVPFTALLTLLFSKPGYDWNWFKKYGVFLDYQNQVTAFQWERFCLLSAHVRTLKDSFHLGEDHIMDRLARLRTLYGGHILPNLHAIILYMDFPPVYSFVTVLLSHKLKTLAFIDDPHSRDLASGSSYDNLLGLLSKQCPDLQELHFNGHCWTLTFSSFDSFTQLASLKLIGEISPGALLSIIRCASLRRLSLCHVRVREPAHSVVNTDSISRLLTSNHTLPSLEDFEIESSAYTEGDIGLGVGAVLEKLWCPNLMHVTIIDPENFRDQVLRWIPQLSMGSPKLTKVT
ncbi:hypothetical protein FRC02_002213, partial [Tulasnella sp. 418]